MLCMDFRPGVVAESVYRIMRVVEERSGFVPHNLADSSELESTRT